jgi:hypothetical protein
MLISIMDIPIPIPIAGHGRRARTDTAGALVRAYHSKKVSNLRVHAVQATRHPPPVEQRTRSVSGAGT